MLATALLLALAQDPDQNQPPPVMPPPRTGARFLGDRQLRIDGSLAEWPALPPIDLTDTRQLSGTAIQAWRGRTDLEAVAFLAWNRSDLYLAARVRDDWHRQHDPDRPSASDVPSADCILFSFDPNRDTRTLGPDRGRAEDRELWLGESGGNGELVLWDRYRGAARRPNEAAVAVVRDPRDGTTTYEARVPWSELLPAGVEPKTGWTFHMQVVVDDYDEPTDPLPQTRIGWTFGTGPKIDPGMFGAVTLLGDVERWPELPAEPPPPSMPPEPVLPRSDWLALFAQLQRNPPAPVTAGGGAPAEAGGAERLRALRQLDAEIAAFPRLDFLGLQHRIHRRMKREVAGIVATGLPYFWDHALAELARAVPPRPPERTLRIFRLPQGGFLIRSATASFGIDAAGHDLEQRLFGAFDFVLLSSPLDVAKRSDPILLRLASAERPLLMHIAIHLPGFDAAKLPIAELGRAYTAGGVKVELRGIATPEGKVGTTVAHRIEWPDGTVLLHVPFRTPAEVLRDQGPVDVLILSARCPDAEAIAAAVAPRLILLDDVLVCHPLASDEPRADLDRAFQLQNRLRPRASLLLAPGDRHDVDCRR
jgi:hypothetical protein